MFLKIIVVLISLYLSCNLSCAFAGGVTIETMPSVTFGVVTDIHEGQYSANYDNGSVKLAEAVTAFNDTWTMDFIVSLGDNIEQDHGADDNIDIANFQTLNGIFAAADVPVYQLTGNHDLINLSLAQFVSTSNYEISSTGYGSFDFNGFHFVALKGDDGGATYWSMSATQQAWLTADLAASSLPTIIFTHYNYSKDFCSIPPTGYTYGCLNGLDQCPNCYSAYPEDAATVRAIFEADGGVIAVFQGHTHIGYSETVNNIRYINVDEMLKTSNPDSTAYAVVKIYPSNRIIVTGTGRMGSY